MILTGPDHGAGLLEGRATPIHLLDKHTALHRHTASARTPEEGQGTFRGEGGKHNSKGLPKASLSLCQAQAHGHMHCSLQATQSMSAAQHSGRKKPGVPRMKGPGEISPAKECMKVFWRRRREAQIPTHCSSPHITSLRSLSTGSAEQLSPCPG